MNSRWLTVCPVIFRDTDKRKLPNPTAFDLAIRHRTKSLMFHGKTGRGKSRCAWEILRLSYIKGATFSVLDSMAGIQFAGMFSEGAYAVKEWMSQILDSDVILLDDVFKAKLTDAYDAFLYAIIDQRTASCRQLVVTCNDTGETLRERLSQDRSEPMIRRLRESCHAIAF